jgi:hypothetical protein
VRLTLEAPVTSRATLTGVATNVVTIVKRVPAAAAAAITIATPIVATILKTRLSHHGPLADVADEATHKGGEHVADRFLRRAVKRVTRTTTFRA